MKNQDLNTKTKKISRRSFLSALSLAGLSLSGLFGIFANIRFLKPTVEYGLAKIFRVGLPESFQEGTVQAFETERVVVIRDKRGFAAVSLVCTHLGCTVRPSSAGFECPCHGSQFDELGNNTGGPAPKPLEWYQINLAPNGELEIDKGIKISQGTFYHV